MTTAVLRNWLYWHFTEWVSANRKLASWLYCCTARSYKQPGPCHCFPKTQFYLPIWKSNASIFKCIHSRQGFFYLFIFKCWLSVDWTERKRCCLALLLWKQSDTGCDSVCVYVSQRSKQKQFVLPYYQFKSAPRIQQCAHTRSDTMHGNILIFLTYFLFYSFN